MKVLQINAVFGVGGSVSGICRDLADELSIKGNECMVAYSRKSVPENYRKYAYRIGSSADVMVNGIKSRIFDNEGFNARRQTKHLIEFIEDYAPDIVHLHNLHGYYINIEVLLTYLAASKIPTVCTMHDCWAVTGHCAYFTTVKCERWKTGCHDCPQKKCYPASFLVDQSKSNWEKKKRLYSAVENMTVVTPSKWLADIMGESYLGCKKIVVINNGIDTDLFKPVDSNFRKNYGLENIKIILGVAGSWSKSKGLDDFVQLSKILEDQYKIVLVGLNEKQKKSLPENILGITKTSNRTELAEIYSASDVFVNPTYQDNYPTTNLEARACGTPVITYRTGGSPESAGKNAEVVDAGNVEGLMEGIKKIIRDGSEVSSNPKEISRKTMTETYISLYEELARK